MSNRALGWLIAVSASVALWYLIATVASAITIQEMLNRPREYFPSPCDHEKRVCVLTGFGGIVSVWIRHVERHKGYSFVVDGVCASACEIAARRANARLLPGSRLIKHAPQPPVWQ